MDHPDGCRLAGAVGTEDAEAFSNLHLEVYVIHGNQVPEALGQVAGNDGGRRHGT
jgi:hypothetical protein